MKLHSILVVDDEPSVLAITVRLLQRLGFTVLAAPDGETGLQQLRAYPGPIDCALLDMTLQGNTGVGLAAAIRQCQPELPIVLMSGYDVSDALAQLAGSGSARFLPKPFQLSELRDQLYDAMACRTQAVGS